MKTVLVVDDNPVVRRHLRGLLERDACLVFEAQDGAEALHALASHPFDVAFLDLQMPNVDGLAVLEIMKARQLKVPVVLITSSDNAHDIMRAVKLGAKDYLLKPFREPQVRRAMQVAAGLDHTTIHRSRADVAVLDQDEGLAQTVRTLVSERDVIEHAEQLSDVPQVVARPHQLVVVGSYPGAGRGSEAEEAEALGDLVTQHDPHAVLLRLISAPGAKLPELTVFHAAVAREDELRLKQALRAVSAASCLGAGRLVRVRKYEGPPEFEPLYWCALRVSLQASLLRMMTGGNGCTVDLTLAPASPHHREALEAWLREFGQARMTEFQVVNEDTSLPPAPPPPVVPGPAPLAPPSAEATRPQAAYTDVTRPLPNPVAPHGPPPSAPAPVPDHPAFVSTPPPGDVAPFALPGYEVHEKVGEGGMSLVYRAVQKSLRRQVCLKVLRSELAEDPSLAQRFHDEGIALAALRHPNIVSVLDVGRADNGYLYLLMEYVEGGDLKALLQREEKVPVRRAVELVAQLLGGLAEAHGSGIIHRDLKPSNVLLSRLKDGSTLVKLVDFGIAKLFEGLRRGPSATRVGTVVGTPGYMAPEQLLGMEVGPATDLYAVGIMLFELLTGRRPFVARDEFELAQLTMMTPAPHLEQFMGEVPPELERLLGSLLTKNPRERPQDAGQVRADLLRLLATLPA